MATEVSPAMNRDSSEMLVTRDLLGELSKVYKSKEIDQKQNLWVSREWDSAPLCDFKRGTIHTQMSQRYNSPDSPLSSTSFKNENHKYYNNNKLISSEPSSNSTLKPLLEESCSLELKLYPSANNYYYPSQSVCTLDKVKSALQKLETSSRKRSLSPSLLSLSSPSTAKQGDGGGRMEERVRPTGLMFAAGCPGCLLYVMTSKSDPKCPRCKSIVPDDHPLVAKKPRIDLNNASL